VFENCVKSFTDFMKTTAVRLKDIAKKTGVSITTVSRILNGRDTAIPIREETRQRVLLAAAELGYRPNLLARGLRGSRSSLVGVILRDISDPFHIQILQGLHDAATQRGYRLFLGHADFRPDAAVAYGSMFEQSHADGVIIVGDIEGDEAALEVLTSQHQYIVGATDRITRRTYPGVYTDNTQGAQLALDHLWTLGHRNIICVSDPRIRDGRFRVDLYRQFMQEHGIEEKTRVYMTTQDPQASYEVGQEIFSNFSQPEPPTAIFAASDTIAIYLMQAAFQAGINIPNQVSIVGYDNIDMTPFTIPPLTTVNQFGVEMGQSAANLLLDMIEKNQESDEVNDEVLSPALVVRQSTSAPPVDR
jgi:DNA-binding LacI/PurR family transcriptional regulator